MATIGSIAVNIIAKTDKFLSGLNSAQSGLARFAGKLNVMTTAVGAFGGYALASMAKQAIEAGGEIADMSAKLHVATDALGALRYAAVQLGGSSVAMDNALAIMGRTIGNLGAGSKQAESAFARLGLTFDQLRGLRTEQQFLAIVDAINKLPTSMEQAAAAQLIFGRGAKELSSVISAGTMAIVEMGDAAAATGQLLTEEQAKALDETADAVASLTGSWSALWQQLVAVGAPALTAITKTFEVLLRGLRAGWNATQYQIAGGLELLFRGLQKLASGLNYLLPKFAELPIDNLGAIADEFAALRKQEGREVLTPLGLGKGPLSANTVQSGRPSPAAGEGRNAAATAQNTATQVRQNDEIIRALKQSPRIAVAGVR